MSKLGLGTAAIGRPLYINIQNIQNSSFERNAFEQKGLNLLDKAYSIGIRYFDTAPGYGLAEQLLIDWQGKNDEIEIATKWGYTYVADFKPDAKIHELKEHSLSKLEEQWVQSQKLLTQLSTYQIHSATIETEVLENEAVLNKLAEIKSENGLRIGLSTTGHNQIEVIQKAIDIEVNGVMLFDVFQVTYNVLEQSLLELVNYFDNTDRRLVIKEALANGRLFRNQNFPAYESVYNYLESLANSYQVGVDAIALRFCIDSLPVYKVLSGASNEQHLLDNMKAESIRLLDIDLEQLRELSVDSNMYWNERKKLKWN